MPTFPRALLVVALLLPGCHPTRSAPRHGTIAQGGATADPLVASLDSLAPRWLAEHKVPSVAVAYLRDGAVQWTRVYGEQAAGVRATPQTLYNVASLAKPVSAETMLRLASRGRVSLDEPLAAHWVDPDVAADPRHQRLTLRLALGHRTGFPNWRPQGGALAFQQDPGTQLGYSGEGYEYARRFAERKLGAPWETLLSETVLEPLGMKSTSPTRKDWFERRIAVPFGPEGRYGEPSIRTAPLASDDLYTTIGDYAAFLASVIARRGLDPRIAAQRDSMHVVNEAATARCDPSRVRHCPRIGMGLGWEVLEFPGETVRLHTGSDWGESAVAFYIAERRAGAVVLTNGAAGTKVWLRVIDLLFPETSFAEVARAQR